MQVRLFSNRLPALSKQNDIVPPLYFAIVPLLVSLYVVLLEPEGALGGETHTEMVIDYFHYPSLHSLLKLIAGSVSLLGFKAAIVSLPSSISARDLRLMRKNCLGSADAIARLPDCHQGPEEPF
jgi:hypothetical protein